MIQQLPDGCGVLIGSGPAKLVFTSPVRVERIKFTPGAAAKVTRRGAENLLRDDDDNDDMNSNSVVGLDL
jgi:hypothetical protein